MEKCKKNVCFSMDFYGKISFVFTKCIVRRTFPLFLPTTESSCVTQGVASAYGFVGVNSALPIGRFSVWRLSDQKKNKKISKTPKVLKTRTDI